jgi:hypothetical protein
MCCFVVWAERPQRVPRASDLQWGANRPARYSISWDQIILEKKVIPSVLEEPDPGVSKKFFFSRGVVPKLPQWIRSVT